MVRDLCRRVYQGMVQGCGAVRTRCIAVRSEVWICSTECGGGRVMMRLAMGNVLIYRFRRFRRFRLVAVCGTCSRCIRVVVGWLSREPYV